MSKTTEEVKVEEPSFDDSVRIVDGVIEKYQKHHSITFTRDAIESSVKYAKRYLSEKNLPDIALDIIDEAGSEFSVKEEFAGTAVTEITLQLKTLEKLIAECEGKDPEKHGDAFDQLYTVYDSFSRDMDRLHEFWGHRLQSEKGGVS